MIKYVFIVVFSINALWCQANEDIRFEHLELPSDVNSRINCILEDAKGVMWFGTNGDLINYDAYQIRIINCIYEDGTRRSFGTIHGLVEDSNNQIWIATASGVFIYNKSKGTTRPINDQYLSNKICRTIYITSNNEVLIGTEDGLYIYNHQGEHIESYSHQAELKTGLSHQVIRCLYKDGQNRIWVGTFDGLNCLDRKKNKITHYKLQKSDSLYKHNNLILSITPQFADSDSILLVGTETGLCIFNTYENTFEQIKKEDKRNSLSNSVIKTIYVQDSKVWLGTDLGLNLFYLDENRFENLFHNYKNTYSISNNVIQQLYIDKQNNLWLATDNGIDKVYLRSNKVLQNKFYIHSNSLEGEYVISDIADQKDGNVWIATNQGLIKYDKQKDDFQHLLPPQISHNKTRKVVCDEQGMVWISTAGGLDVYDSGSNKFYRYVANEEIDGGLKTNYLNSIACGVSGDVWIGTHNKGIYKAVKEEDNRLSFLSFQHQKDNINSLNRGRVSDIIIDKNNNVWVATSNGLNKIDVLRGKIQRFTIGNENSTQYVTNMFIDENQVLWLASAQGVFVTDVTDVHIKPIPTLNSFVNSLVVKDSVVYYTNNNGFYYSDLRQKEILRIPNAELGLKTINSVKLLNSNSLVLFGKEGFVSLKMHNIVFDKSIPKVHWTNFSILNKPISPNEKLGGRYVLNKHIDETEFIELKYAENTFTMEFSSLQYSYSSSSNYQYILDGYDIEWKTTNSNQAFVSYTQVRPGTYTLKVKASNKYGFFGDEVREITIKVKAPLYLSGWAIALYCIIIIVLFFISRRMLVAREKFQNDMRFETMQRQKSEELIEIKTRFFTNISHELKTPLTLISSPIDDLLDKDNSESVRNSLLLVKRNADRLKKLVSQILDIRKIESGGEKLKVQEYDIIRFSDRIINQFKEEAERRNMLLQYHTEERSLMMWFDMEKLEKVLVNLISNAMKFTPDGGCIRIQVKDGRKQLRKQNELFVSVTDDGCGISKQAQLQIFDRFNTQGAPNYSNQQGTGIGLSLVKDYVDMHGGEIKVESNNNEGSTFTFTIPFNREKFGAYEEHKKEEIIEEELSDFNVGSVVEIEEGNEEKANGKPTVLVVEDDHDMRDYIVSGLNDNNKVIYAENGVEGLKLALNEVPDMIVSDWMMPQMNGIELCEKIKSDLRTCHIPLILLTAKGGLDNKTEGIEIGADDYIQKPFSMNYLQVRIKNLREQRERLKKVYKKQNNLEPSEVTVTSLDEKFLLDIMDLLEKDMDNPELNVKTLSEKMGMSHTNLYRKIKALTDQTATEFIRTIRLKRAAQLLKSGQLNVSEVMYMVGFSHRSYFTQSFKAMYGVSPKEYK